LEQAYAKLAGSRIHYADASPDPVKDFLEKYEWKYGEKLLKHRIQRLGLKDHLCSTPAPK